ncbi:MAG: hypothetical protein BWY36_00650 [Candidatus Diapherotrites archaeon ADurb.Bin253]|jgi:hypothetical protein|nr:MAG: hypothetical protein BWY36_00650 [Candidatus Diapherotrites archaeon ADurb.Bin253]HNZ52341.1 hypothetical protein [Candidatus Pacearchaeota archaeon]HOH04418.1 hypothetical protein [Candidatus Pacearchaeota archaeon]HOU79577.1 hypothetical protein [Candidatus Pacearchaeota archaeon]HQF83277.1 hypothetical protein [Candidatus Pacearchaeota archaeon]
MAGLTTHLIIVFVFGASIWIFSKRWYYAAAFGLGHLIPDLISFGITGIRQKSANPGIIMTNDWFSPLATFSHNALNWAAILLVLWLGFVLLYSFKKIDKKQFAGYILVLIYFIFGVILHLIVDKLIIEHNYWI